MSLIESGQEALKNERFEDAFKKFCQADDLARFFATSEGMAESMFRMVGSRVAQGGIDSAVKENMLRMLHGALTRIQDVRKETDEGKSGNLRHATDPSSSGSRRLLCQTALTRANNLEKLIEPLIKCVEQTPTIVS